MLQIKARKRNVVAMGGGRGETSALIGGGGDEYSYIRVLPD